MKSDNLDLIVGIVSCPDRAVATALARTLVHSKVAACVTICPGVESVYWWNDELCTTKELLLLIKSTHALVPSIKEIIAQEHPYEVPELLIVPPTDALESYATWVRSSVVGGTE
jgi:periplasmic divalent cation tolerance protein